MNCGVCGNSYRSGTEVWVPEVGGKTGVRQKMVRKRACNGCAKRAMLIVASMPVARCRCGAPATQCHVCGSRKETAARKDGADVKAIVKKLKVMKLAYEDPDESEQEYRDGRVHGLESAIELLESGRW